LFNKYPIMIVIGSEFAFLMIVYSRIIKVNMSIVIISLVVATIVGAIVSHRTQ